jgi:hypothetical protein
VSIQVGLPGLFAFGNPDGAHAPRVVEDEPSKFVGEAAAVRVLYQAPPRRRSRPSGGKRVRDFLASLLESLMPRPAPAYARVPAYARAPR